MGYRASDLDLFELSRSILIKDENSTYCFMRAKSLTISA